MFLFIAEQIPICVWAHDRNLGLQEGFWWFLLWGRAQPSAWGCSVCQSQALLQPNKVSSSTAAWANSIPIHNTLIISPRIWASFSFSSWKALPKLPLCPAFLPGGKLLHLVLPKHPALMVSSTVASPRAFWGVWGAGAPFQTHLSQGCWGWPEDQTVSELFCSLGV